MNDLSSFMETAVTFVATYFVHSTILLAACWLILGVSRTSSHYLAERMWKLAAVLGVATAALQLLMIPSKSPAEVSLQVEAEPVTDESTHPYLYDESINELPQSFAFDTAGEWPDAPIVLNADVPELNSDTAIDLPPEATADQELELAEFDLSQLNGTSTDGFVEADVPFAAAETLDATPAIVENSRPAIFATVLLEFLPTAIQVCSIVMLCGGVVGGLLLMIQATRWRLRLGRIRVVNDGAAFDALQRFRKRHKIQRRVRLLASNHHAEPFAYGLMKWTIVLPEGIDDRLDRNELKALIAHEMAHLVRGDVSWLWIGRLLCTCGAFQPLNFLARRRWQQACEFLCDDWAIERGVRSLALARCLTRVAEWRFGIESHDVGLAAGGSKATLVERVQRLVDESSSQDAWKSPWRRRALTMSAAVAVVGLVGFMPRIALSGVALPLARVSDYVAVVTSTAIDSSIEQSATSDWHALEEELLQLDADLAKVNQLRVALPPGTEHERASVNGYFENLNRRAASLRSRRKQIASLIEKESER